MREAKKLEEIARELQIPTSTVVSWLVERGHRLHYRRGRWYITSPGVDAIREECTVKTTRSRSSS